MLKLKKVIEKTWFSIFLFTLICIGTSRVFKERPQKVVMELSPKKSVTPSLDKYSSQLNEQVLFFNRVPKTGSEMFVLLLQWLQGDNGFKHVRLSGGNKRRLLPEEQKSLVDEVWAINKEEKGPVSFDRHLYFTNFTEFSGQYPIFMNLVRDPVDKLISRFYYGRVTPNPLNPDIKYAQSTTPKAFKTGSFERCFLDQDSECTFQNGYAYDLTIPYFCGQFKQCMILNDRWALARAKRNIELFYPVVGVLEELNSTLTVLEKKIPAFFKGVKNMYFNELLEPHKNKNRMRPRTTSANVRYKLKKQLWAEYDLYYWLKARLLQQEYS